MMYLFDTDFLIGYLRNNAQAVSKMRLLLQAKNFCFITPVNIHELIKGAYLSKNVEENFNKAYTLIQSLNFVAFDKQSVFLSGKLFVEQEKKGQISGENDIFIAAIALRYGLVLLTRNKKHFQDISGLKMEEW